MADVSSTEPTAATPETKPAPKASGPEIAAGAKANAAFAKARLEAKQYQKRVQELEAQLAEIERAKLSEEERIRKDLETYKPKAEQAARYEAGIAKILEIELGEIPEDKRDLVPNLDPLAKLEWVRSAKAKGLFAPPPAPLPERKPSASSSSPQPGNGTAEREAQAKAAIEAARKTGNPLALVQAMKRWGRQ